MSLFLCDGLTKIMLSLIVVIGSITSFFAKDYMKGDRLYGLFFIKLLLLTFSVCIMVSANHIVLFFVSWVASNCLLVSLMIHKSSWRPAYESGKMALHYFSLGFACLFGALAMLSWQTGSWHISKITHYSLSGTNAYASLVLLTVVAMIQSGLWPFHGWILNSLNSPTPVSAFMHAGLVNGGGFLLVRFAPLFLQFPLMLQCIFFVGMVSATVGIFFKLIQSDVKRMLVCSTIAQLGFVFIQCGLGFFSSAVAHYCWHSLFKAYLFLSANTLSFEKIELIELKSWKYALLAIIPGLLGSSLFMMMHHLPCIAFNSSLLLCVVSFFAVSQMAITLLQKLSVKNYLLICFVAALFGLLYGVVDISIELVLMGMNLFVIQPLRVIYLVGLIVIIGCWLLMLGSSRISKSSWLYEIYCRLYVWAMRASQATLKTTTVFKKLYSYK